MAKGINATKRSKGILSLALALAVVIAVAIGWKFLGQNNDSPEATATTTTPQNLTTVKGFVGGEKIELLQDPEFTALAAQNGITVDYKKAGSIEMAAKDYAKDQDFIAPSSEFAANLYKENGGKAVSTEVVLNTPIVLYSYKDIADKLVTAGIATKDSDGSYSVNMQKLTEAQLAGTKWSDWGITDLYGNVAVQTTDPNASNSGNMFLALQATALNNNQPVTPESVDTVAQKIKTMYQRVGYSPASTADLFNQMLHQGKGANPLTAGYESQMIEFAIQHPDDYNKVKDNVVIMYPTPTIWSSHVVIALDDQGKKVTDLMLNPEVQKLAWKKHGFRTVVAGSENENLPVTGIRKDITNVMQQPRSDVMTKLMDAAK